MENWLQSYKEICNWGYFRSVLFGAVLLAAGLTANICASSLASESVSLPVTDLILSHVRVYDVDAVIITASLLLIFFGILRVVLEPKSLPFVLKSMALFFTVRSVFVSLTHIGPFTPHLLLSPGKLVKFLGLQYAGDLFFSGHTGLPFLWAFMFWDEKKWRWIFLTGSVILGASMLLGHLHYSIDVMAAFFITYTTFHIALRLFHKDWGLFHSPLGVVRSENK